MATDRGLLAGLSDADLQAQLTAAQLAYMQLQSGTKAVKMRYQQGGSDQEIEYTAANQAGLANLIQMLQQALGVIAQPRRPLNPRF